MKTLCRLLMCAASLGVSGAAWAQAPTSTAPAPTPTAMALLKAMDANLQSDSQTARAKMIVDDAGRVRTYEMTSFAQGKDTAAVEYEAPAREKGTRMLKVGDELWLYMPRAERVQKISGHMMRQGMMGSDVSYEDVMAAQDFEAQYDAKVLGKEDLGGRPHWKIEATAKDGSVTYPKRVIWIDVEHLIPSRQALYALSGMLLKTWTMSEVKAIDGRHVPMKMVIADALRKGSSTTLITEDVQFDVKLPDQVFSRRWLERGR